MPTLPFLAAAAIPTLCVPSDLTNPFVLPGLFAGAGLIDVLMMAALPSYGARVLRRVTVGRFKPWLVPALRWIAIALIALGGAILAADGWIWLQALRYTPWCVPPGVFSDAAKDAQLARLNIAGVLGFSGMLAGICLGSLSGIVVMLLLNRGLNRRSGLGGGPAAQTTGGM